MKTSNVLASLLFTSLSAAAPLNKRDYVTKTNTVVETVVVFTTVWGEQQPVAQATSAGLFYENPGKPSHHGGKPSSVAAPSSAAYTPPANTPSPPAVPSSVYTPPAVSTPAPAPSSVYTPPPVQSPSPAPEPSSVYTPPAAPASSAPAAPAPAPSTPSSGGGEVHSGGSITMNYFAGGTGACGQPISDDSMTVALASDLFGESTYDVQTGNPTNKWCNAKVEIDYNGAKATATIMDRCPGCTDGGFDMTPKLWEAITGGAGGASGDRLYGATWKVVS